MKSAVKALLGRLKGVFGMLLGTYLIIILLSLTVLTVSFSFFIRSFYIGLQERELVSQGRELASMLADSTHMPSRQVLAGILGIADRFVDGRILILSVDDIKAPDSFLAGVESARLLKGRTVSRTGRVPGFPGTVLTVATPVSIGGKTEGAVLVSSPLSGLTPTIARVRGLAIASAGLAIIMAILIAIRLSGNISRPLAEMNSVAKEVAKGNYKAKAEVLGYGEIGELGVALNRMSDDLARTVNILRHEKKRTLSILESMSEGVIAVDHRGRTTVTNPAADRILDGLKDRDPERLAEVGQSLKSVLENGGPLTREWDDTGDGGRVHRAYFAPILDDLDLMAGAVGVFMDVSDQRRLECMQRQFVADVSHELRTPLTAIRGFAEAIADGVVTDPGEVARLGSIVAEEAERLGRLVGDLLDLSRMEAGYSRLDLSPVSVSAVARRVMAKLAPSAGDAGMSLILDGPHGADVVLADPDRLEQILTNLVANAIHHSHSDGVVTIRVSEGDGYVTCSVIDSGVGIPENELPHIWERFRRVKGVSKGSGTGLGLAIAKRLVESHGGQVSVRSEAPGGSEFTVRLPRIVTPLQ